MAPTDKLIICLDNAAVQVQQDGKTPRICEANSGFSILLSSCQTCIAASGAPGSGAAFDLISPAFQQFVEYCQGIAGTNQTLIAKIESYQSAVSSVSSAVASLARERSLLGLMSSTLADNTTSNYAPTSNIIDRCIDTDR